MPEESGGWRIDDLARRTSLTVDTIRFYQREGLLQPAAKVGRTKEFGPDHLARLERIRELQAKRFSLAAIRALLDADRGADLVEEVFAGDIGVSYTLDELIQKSGINDKTVAILRSERLLRDPAEFGQSTYDANDLDMIRAVG
ncbi:MAG: MerR family transcriptional regulator, partial [Actinobacteria bacterium]|nr:MerR family transcriptional regulator [Actinomycetota bacterium]